MTDSASADWWLQSRRRLRAAARWLYRELHFWRAACESRLSGPVTFVTSHDVTLIIPSYHRARARNLDVIVRNALRCPFVRRVIVSNHNPDLKVRDWVTVGDDRVTLIDQPVRRGCGQGWIVASEHPATHYLVVDDDTIPRPEQLARLFAELLADPSVPHGMAGWQSQGEFVERREADVECVFCVYAVTRQHVERYVQYVHEMTQQFDVAPEAVEFYADDLVISHTGPRSARVHDLGWVLRCRTSDRPDVAISQDKEFWPRRIEVLNALRAIKAQESAVECSPRG